MGRLPVRQTDAAFPPNIWRRELWCRWWEMFLACSGWMRNHCYLRQQLCHVCTPPVTGTARNHELGEKSHSATAIGCAIWGNIPLVFPVNLQLFQLFSSFPFSHQHMSLCSCMNSSSDAKHLWKMKLRMKNTLLLFIIIQLLQKPVLTPLSPFSRIGRREEEILHIHKCKARLLLKWGAQFVCKKKKPSALLETSSPTRFQRQKLFGGKFPAHPSVSSQTWVQLSYVGQMYTLILR